MKRPLQNQADAPQSRHELSQPMHAMGLLLARLAQMPQDVQTREILIQLESCLIEMRSLLEGASQQDLEPSKPEKPLTAAAMGDAAATPFTLEGRRVLVVEDDTVLGHAFELLLQSWGCESRITEGLPEAQACIACGFEPEVILSDYRLGGQANGIETIKALQAEMRRPAAACLLSGDLDPDLLSRAEASGLVILYKPVRPAKLRVLLRNLLQTRSEADT